MYSVTCGVKIFHRENFPDERIPHLEEVVDLCVNVGLQMYIDVKAATQAGKVSYNNAALVSILLFDGVCGKKP